MGGRGTRAAMVIGAIAVPAAALVMIYGLPSRGPEEGPMNFQAHASVEALIKTCEDEAPVVVSVRGSYRSRSWIDEQHRPALMVERREIPLSDPYFAAELSAPELCSKEESSPTNLRVVCLGSDGKPMTIALHVYEDGKTLGGSVDGRPLEWSNFVYPPERHQCLTFLTGIPKRDLGPLQRAYLDDSASERCRTSKAPRRKVPAVVQRVMLPKDDPRAGQDYLHLNDGWPQRLCRDVTKVKLALPPDVGPSQDLGVFADQCERCSGGHLEKPNGVEFRCHGNWSSSAMLVYQLGDHLYFTEEDRIRRVPLPCGVELDFRIDEFITLLGIEPHEAKKK